MSDWLDDMLLELPAQPYPMELTRHIQDRISKARRRSRWAQLGIRLAMVGAGLGGVLLIVPRIDPLITAMVSISSLDPIGWASMLLQSPDTAVVNLIGNLMAWLSQFSMGNDPGLLLSFGLLAAPAFYAVITLLSDKIPQEGAWT